jgi:PAS domain S-box-containing protein
MEINGKAKTPITAAQSKKNDGHGPDTETGKSGGKKARGSSRTSKSKTNGVESVVLERISDGILALDAGLNYTYLNQRAGELLGCDAAELIGMSLWEAHPQAKGAPFAEACRRALETQTIVPLDGYFPASDRWLEGRVYPSKDGVSVLFTEGGQQKQDDNRRREERYRILFDTMQEGFLLAEVIHDENGQGVDGRLLEVNASMARFLDKTRDELVGRTAREIFTLDEQDLDTLGRACRVGLGEEEPFFVEQHDPVTGRWLRGHVFSPRHGQFASLLSDVTEQKQAEAKIQDISKFPGENPNPVLRFTQDGQILYANQASTALLAAWENGEDHTTPLAEIQELLPSVMGKGLNTEIEVANNGMFYTGLLVPVREQGYINLYLRDITGRKQVEESLRAHINQTNAGITRTSLDARFTFVNQAFCDMLGYSESELIGKSIWDISHPDDIAKNKRMFERMVLEAEPFQLEKRILRKNGSILWTSVGTSPMREASGRIQAATSIIVDITRRKRAEESLLDSARRSLYLSSLSDVMRSLADPSKIQAEAARLLGTHLKASRVAYVEVETDGRAFVRDNYVNGVPDIIGQFPIDTCIPVDQAPRFRAGRTVTASDVQNDSRYSDAQKSAHEALSIQAQIVFPFIRNGEVIAALCIQHAQPRIWKNEEISLVEETAQRIQAAIERAHAERKLRESEQRLRLASHAAGMCTWELNIQEQTYTLGENFAEVLGFPADILPKNSAELDQLLNVEEDMHAVREAVSHAIQTRSDLPPLQFRVVNPETEDVLWLEVNARFVYGPEGKPHRIFGMVQNITERRSVEELLRAKEAELEEIIHHTPFMLTRCTRDLRYRFVSRAYAEMIGRTPEEVVGRPIAELMGEQGFNTIRPYVERVLQGERVEFESMVPFHGAQIPWLHVVYTPDRDGHGNVTGWFASIVDITERRQMEEALRESEAKLTVELADSKQLQFISSQLILEDNINVLYEQIVNAATALMHSDIGSLQMLHPEKNELKLLAWKGFDPASAAFWERVHANSGSSCGMALSRGERVVVMDVETSGFMAGTEDLDFYRLSGIRSVQSTPLVSRDGHIVGMISTHWRETHQPSERELHLLDVLARQAADLIERRSAEQELADYARQQEALFQLADKLHRTESLEEVFDPALDAILNALQCDRASILLFDDADVMRFVAWRGLSDAYRQVTDGHSPWKRDEKNAEPICIHDIGSAELDGSLKTVIQEEGIGALSFIPLVSNGKLIGKFMVYFNTPHTFAEDELELSLTIARQLASNIERKQTEDALRQSEERFVRFMQHLPGLAWIKDVQGRYVYANAAAEKAFGTQREKLYGRTDEDIFPAEVAVQYRRNDDQAMLDEKGVQVVETLQHEDGILHYSLVNKFPIPGPDGRPALIGGTAFDITERIQMEEALQVAREKAEATAYRIARLQKVTAALSENLTATQVAEVVVNQGAPALGAVTSSILLLSEDNQTLEIMYTAAPESIIRPYTRFPLSLNVPAADAARTGQPVWIETQQQYLERYPHLADQINAWGHQAGMAVPMAYKGRTLGVLTMSFDRDLTASLEDQDYALTLARQGAQALERARAENALRESEDRYRAIISQATAGIVRKDASGKMLFVNQAFCNMLDRTDSDLMGTTMWELTHETDVGENKRLYNRLMAEGTPFQLEKRLIRRDGSILWVNVSVSPVLDLSGKPHAAVSVYVDITRRKQAENRLTLLSKISELTRDFEEPNELFFAVSRAVGEHFQVRRSLFNEIDVENDREIIRRDYCRGVESVAGMYKISDYSSSTSAEMKAGKTVVNHDSKLDPRTARDYERFYVEHGERAYVAVPLMHEDRWVASLWVSDDKPREWDKDDVYLLEAIAERTWTAAEKLRIDRALRDSEERLRVTFNTTAVGFATLTPDTHFVDVNDAFCSIVGYSREDLLKMNFDGLTHPNFAEDTRKHVAQLIAGQVHSFTLEKIYIRRDGTEIWIQNSVSLVRDVDGNPHHLIAICQDITERKREEEALRARTEEIEALMEVSPIAIYIAHDPKCIRISGNPAAYNLIQLPLNSQKNLSKSAPEEERPNHRVFREGVELAVPELPIQAAARLGREIEEETLELRFENGMQKYIYAYAKPLFDSNGNSRGAIAAMLDITERKRAEEQLRQLNLELEERVLSRTSELQSAYEFLRESEATSRLILESMPDAIVITDQDGRIVHANTQIESLFGYSPNEVLGQPVEILLPERSRRQHMKNRDVYASQRNRRIMGLGLDLFGRRKDKSEFPVDVMLSPINNNTSWDVMVSIRDNTKQRQAQEALRTNEEKLRTLFEILPVGISFLNKEGRISEMNSALTEILGLSKSELLRGAFKGRRYIRADGTPMEPSEFASRRAVTEQKTIYNVETGIIRENGEVTWTSVNAAPVQVADVEAAVVTIDITQRKQAEEALHRHRERLRILSRRLVEVQEEERRAIARELHDRVGQNLAALTLNLNILRNQLSVDALEKIGSRLNDSVNLVNDILTITRSVMADLRPNVLDDYGLDAAINEYADRFTQRFGVPVSTNTPQKPTPRLDPGVEMTLLRIAQEALTNIARHAQASQASMSLEMKNDSVFMTIEDNGTGIMSWQKVNQLGSHGLRIMRERAEAFGGELKVNSTYKNGTRIEVKIPLGSGTRNKASQEKRS